ncbi:MAG: NAD(P)H-binding protein, partial [Cyanobacteria bacterium]|nr:NAD(P)H-binding protein [Cyanobacteriota bacterium]
MNPRPKILVTGATGYVGGRLIPRLLELGFPVVALGRSMAKLLNRPWSYHPLIEVKAVDLFQEEEMLKATQDCKIAYYFIHSMNPDHSDFVASDRRGAEIFTRIAAANQFDRIIYLGGLGEDNPQLSKHLRSRFEVAQILKSGPVPVTDLRAAMIIGSGSASFEILRYLVDRLPIMLTPKWVETPSQPIAIRDVLSYLLGVLEKAETIGETYDIGGGDVITYRELMAIYAEEAHLAKRIIIPVPVFSPKLSSHWIHLITPLSSAIARPLAEGLKNPVVCLDKRIRDIIPINPISCREAIRLALIRMEERKVETHWSDAGYLPPPEKIYAGDPRWAGGTAYKDKRY